MDNHEIVEEEFSYVKETIVDKAKVKRKRARIIIISIFVIIIILIFIFVWIKYCRPIFFDNSQSNQLPNGDSNPIEIMVDEDMEQNQMNIDDYKSIYSYLKAAGDSASKYMVTVKVISKDNDWLYSYTKKEGITSGIITGIDDHIYILTDYETVNQANKLMVEFVNGISVEANILKVDENSGVTILKLPTDTIDEKTKSLISEASYGKSDKMEPGDPIIIVGNPYGNSHYMTFGALTSTTSYEGKTDSLYQLLVTDVVVSGKANGFIINLDGNVIGMISPSFSPEGMQNILSGVGISELKPIISKLSSGKSMPYLGINGQEINKEIIALAQEEMPYGIYVKGVEIGSPAYNLGIVSGDIIVKLDGKEVFTLDDYSKILNNKNLGEKIDITLNRNTREGYYEYNFSAVLESR